MFKRICSEPYRVFFPLGILMAFEGVGHWLAYAMGWMEGYSGVHHAAIQMRGYMTSFVVGFLLTALPRVSGTPHTRVWEFLLFLALVLANWFALMFHHYNASDICFIVLLVSLGVFACLRFSYRMRHALDEGAKLPPIDPPIEFIWVPFALFLGILGTLILFLGRQYNILHAWLHLAEHLVEQGFILAIVIGVGGFLVPRLLGQSQTIKSEEITDLSLRAKRRRQKLFLHLSAILFFLASFWAEEHELDRLAYGMRAFLVTFIFCFNRAWPFWPKTQDEFAKLLWCSVTCVIVGYWGVAVFPNAYKAMLHITFIGGYSLMTFAVGTMVILSHAGKSELLRKPLWSLRIIGAGIFLALLFRLASLFFPERYFTLLGLSSSVWLVATFVWAIAILPKVAVFPPTGTSGRGRRAHAMT